MPSDGGFYIKICLDSEGKEGKINESIYTLAGVSQSPPPPFLGLATSGINII